MYIHGKTELKGTPYQMIF